MARIFSVFSRPEGLEKHSYVEVFVGYADGSQRKTSVPDRLLYLANFNKLFHRPIMKKCLFLMALLTVACTHALRAQPLFVAPDTVCINQPVKLVNNVLNATNYYWGFCSGNLTLTPSSVTPTGSNLGDNFSFSIPGNIDVIEDKGVYYGFVVNTNTREFLRLNYGNSLTNIPTVTNFGNLTDVLPENPHTLFIVREPVSKNWYIFVSGGFTPATSELARLDFGPTLDNPTPNIANFGNHTGMLSYAKGLFIAQDVTDSKWYGYAVNNNGGALIRLDFSFNISNTPLMANLGNVGGMEQPTDMAGIYDNGEWYLLVTDNDLPSTPASIDRVIRIKLGPNLHPAAPTGSPHGNFLNRIIKPSSITLTRDCGNIYAFITDSTTSQLININIPNINDSDTWKAIDYSVVGSMNFPTSISSIIREKDNLYGFITNGADSTLTRVTFQQCASSSIPSFTEAVPPIYTYSTPGHYNVYYVIDQGLPTMKVECHMITVLAPPPLFKSNDTTICRGDTLRLYAVSTLADSIRWLGTYNIDTTFMLTDSVRVWPDYMTRYDIKLYYPFGCIVDTAIKINVRTITADAGPDRYILDGGSTTLGGPYTTIGDLTYHWSPFQFMNDSAVPNPYVHPPYDFSYYLTVTESKDGVACAAQDTVNIRINCGNFNLPNAFAPNGLSDGVNGFGILNNAIPKLNYFRIYNRWGELVFETTDPTIRWNGTYKDKPAPVGVYVWEADGFCQSGKRIKKTGNVSLLR
jgi:gliding motility-associated-like protein